MQASLELYPYQQAGVRFLLDDPFADGVPDLLDAELASAFGKYHKLLADDMGLGKTVQVVAALNELDAEHVVVICPANVKIHWARTIAKFSTRQNYVYVVQDGKSEVPSSANIIVVNYELLLRDKIFRQLVARGEQKEFCAVVIDEAHMLKGLDAQRTQRILGKKSFLKFANYKWALTGTPMLNRPSELYPILYALAPHTIFPHLSWDAYAKYFCNAYRERKCRKCGEKMTPSHVVCPCCHSKSTQEFGINAKGYSNAPELSERLKGFMLRRETKQVLKDLPEIVETFIEVEAEPSASTSDLPMATVRRLLALDKIPEAAKFISDMVANVSKVVVFAYHREVIEKLQAALEKHNAVILYGGMTASDKQESIDRFVNDPNIGVIIAQTVAGGTGVDGLQGVCNHACHVEIDWSPGIMAQANGRLRRVGQQNTVFVYYLVIPDSLDTDMHRVVEVKRNVIEKIIRAKEFVMSFTPELQQAAAGLLSAATNLVNVVAGLAGGEAAAPAPKAPKKTKEKVETPADPPVNALPAAAPAPVAAAAPAHAFTEADIRMELGAFISDVAPGRSDVQNREIINTKIWPLFGVTTFAELKPEQYPAVIEALKKGPAAYAVPAANTALAGV